MGLPAGNANMFSWKFCDIETSVRLQYVHAMDFHHV